MSVWRRGSLTENPYVRNAFRVARLEREVVRRLSVAQRIGEARDVVEREAQAHAIAGKPVTQEEINKAESILHSPERRILEELLVHATEAPPVKHIHRLAGNCAAEMTPGQTRQHATDLSFLLVVVPEFMKRYLGGVKPAEPGFGALELDLAPPFGQQQEEE